MHPTAGQRDVVRFESGTPVVVGLEFDDARQVAGRFGDQYRYWLTEGRIMFVDPPVHEAIQRAGAKAGDELCITKHSKPGRKTQWEVARVEEEPAEAESAAAPASPAPTGTAKLEPAAPRTINSPQGTAASQEAADRLAACLCAAVDAALTAQQYAAQRGLTLAWSAADIRAMAATLHIGSRPRE